MNLYEYAEDALGNMHLVHPRDAAVEGARATALCGRQDCWIFWDETLSGVAATCDECRTQV